MSFADTPLDAAWQLLLAVAAHRRAATLPAGPCGLHAGASEGALARVRANDERAALRRDPDGAVTAGPALTETEREFVELYLPLLGCGGGSSYVVAHLGQSADARIATTSGDSRTITGRADFVHMHRLRALSDAVVVGAGTVAADDPELTTRLVEGPNPMRIVLDPNGRLADGHRVFSDGTAATRRVTIAGGCRATGWGDEERSPADFATWSVTSEGEEFSLIALLETLRACDVRVVFVEGGGVTVARWMEAGLLDRLHLVAAPLLVGEGRVSLPLPGATSMDEARRPSHRLYRLGADVLWDFDLRTDAAEAVSDDELLPRAML